MKVPAEGQRGGRQDRSSSSNRGARGDAEPRREAGEQRQGGVEGDSMHRSSGADAAAKGVEAVDLTEGVEHPPVTRRDTVPPRAAGDAECRPVGGDDPEQPAPGEALSARARHRTPGGERPGTGGTAESRK